MSNRIKILWICGNPAGYKATPQSDGTWTAALQKNMINKDVELSLSFEYFRNDIFHKADGVTYYPIYRPRLKKCLYYFSKKRSDEDLIEKYLNVVNLCQPDIIHCWGSELAYGLIAKRTNIPVVVHIQGIINPYLDAFFPAGYSLFSILRVLNYAPITFLREYYLPYKKFVYAAKRELEIYKVVRYFMGRTEWDKEVTQILAPNSLYYYSSEALRESITSLQKWHFHVRKRLILSTTLSKAQYKGYDVILRTAKLLKLVYGNDFEWNIYGVDEMLIHERLVGIKCSDVNIECRGKVDAKTLGMCLLNSDVYVHLSYIENSPNSVCEAQFLGVPTIATNVGGLKTNEEPGTGVLVPANDAYQTVYNILNIKRSEKKSMEMSRKSIILAEKRHNIEYITSNLLKIYKCIIEEDINK